jgi:hypothetical protein
MRNAVTALTMAGLVSLALGEAPTDSIVAVVKAYERAANTRDVTWFRKNLALDDARFREIEDHIPAPFGAETARDVLRWVERHPEFTYRVRYHDMEAFILNDTAAYAVAMHEWESPSGKGAGRATFVMIRDKGRDWRIVHGHWSGVPRQDAKGEEEKDMTQRKGGSRAPVIDFHVHLRGGMTVEKAIQRQAETGIRMGVLRNMGKGWPIETDAQLRELLDSVEGKPVYVGVQVNDRDWMKVHSRELLDRLDYVLADTMIMPMPNDDSPPVKLWETGRYTIDDPEVWMERYMRHTLRVLAEPVTILANPTYLPAPVKKMYEALWTDERMRTVIQAAVDNGVALEINAKSGLPPDRFIRMAKEMGAKLTFGSNNFTDKPTDMKRCHEVIARHGLTAEHLFLPARRPAVK